MRMLRLLIGLLCLCLAFVMAPAVLADGAQTGTLEGRVLDAEGSPLPGVSINLTGPQGQASTVTDENGRFRFGLLIDGDYTVSAALEGLGSTELSLPVSAGAVRAVDLTLRAATEEQIVVTSEAPLVNKYETSAAATLENEVSENLSFIGRNVQSSLEVLPSVVHTATSRQQGGIQASVNGGQWQENAGLIDGVDTSFARRGGGSRIFLPTTSLTGTTIETAGFSAEYGRVVSGVTTSVIKSGTNQFHGDFLYLPQNQKWKAEYDDLPPIPRDDDIIDSFETSLGGPIVRDKAWFFASYGNMDTNETDLLVDGTVVNVGFQTEAAILKLNVQPSARHQIQLTGVDAPMDKVNTNVNSGDRFTPCDCFLDENLATATWSFAATSSAFVEAKIATQEDRLDRGAVRFRDATGTNPDSPTGNTNPYQDLDTSLRFNAISQGAGLGYLDTGRKQGNASLAVFRGEHDFKFGVDYQDVSSETFNVIGTLYRGRGYNENLPGGYTRPQDKRVFDPTAAVESTSEVYSAYAQDRFDVNDRFNLYVGVRMDNQSFDNDAGNEIMSSTDLVPRLAATYDVNADGKVLLKATAGRYYQVVGQDIFNREYATKPNGTNVYTQFGWNLSTQRYDIFQTRSEPLLGLDPGDFEPYYKDEGSVGVEWQFLPSWAFKARGIYWEIGDTFWSSNQFNAAGRSVPDVRNWDDGYRDYQGVVLEMNRAFREGWTFRTNYTYSNGDGNTFGTGDGTTDQDTLFEYLGAAEVCTANSYAGCRPGSTDVTTRNREGSGNTEREHNLNVVGLKTFPIGKQNLGLGGYFGFRSGEPWGRRATTAVRSSSGQQQNTTTYVTPRDANQMEDTYTLNLTGFWEFPIKGRFQGRLGVEAVNVTNEQEVISINLNTGQPDAGKSAIQTPREYRFQIGVTF